MKIAFLLGLTGSIGMGKSTTAAMFAEQGIPVWDADAAVARLYAEAGAAVAPLRDLKADLVSGGAVDRSAMKAWIATDKTALSRIESVVHPVVAEDRANFIKQHAENILVFDIPLLFEKGTQTEMDAVVVVTVQSDIQRARVLAREGMTEGLFASILARQMPDADKRALADYVIETHTLDGARQGVEDVLADIRKRLANA